MNPLKPYIHRVSLTRTRCIMPTFATFLLLACLGTFLNPAHAAWGDESYDPNPSLFDLDKDAQFDSVALLTAAVLAGNGLTGNHLNFESGFTNGQQLGNWLGLDSTQVRFGFGSDLDQIQWQSRIGQIDPTSRQFGLTHPHGTYGNAPGILDNPRNYVVDHYFLTDDSQSAASSPRYFAIQFTTPVSFIEFAVINYAGATGGAAALTLWSGDTLSSAIQVENVNQAVTIPPGTPGGDIRYFVGNGPAAIARPDTRPTFNFAVLSLDTTSSQVGFDNFTVGMAPVPEPEGYAMMLAGVGLLGLVARRARPRPAAGSRSGYWCRTATLPFGADLFLVSHTIAARLAP